MKIKDQGYVSAKKREFIILSLLFSFIFIYLLLRSIYVPLVHDEAGNFFLYTHSGKVFPPEAHWDANNHILNSFLSRLSYLLFGSSRLALRLPSLLFFPLFFFFTYKISNELKMPFLKWGFILSLCLSHNFIEFFALDRGYGMSMALLMASIYFLMKILKNDRLSDYIALMISLALALFSNLTLILSSAIILSILLLNLFFKFRSFSRKKLTWTILILAFGGLTPIIAATKLLLILKAKGLLYYGTLDGFYDLTVISLSKFISASDSLIFPIAILIYSTILILLIIKNLTSIISLKDLIKAPFVFPLLLVGNTLAVIFLAVFFSINYPEDRTGLYFIPYFIASLFFMIDQLDQALKKQLRFLALVPVLFFPIHFLYSMNVTHSSLWITEHIPDSFFEKVKDDSVKENKPFTIGGYAMRTLCWSYRNFREGGDLNHIQSSHYPEYLSDFQIVNAKYLDTFSPLYTIEDYDPISDLSLLKRKRSVKTIPVLEFEGSTNGINKKLFFDIYKGRVDSLIGNSLLIDLEMTILSEAQPLKAWLVVQVNDQENHTLAYEFVALDWKKTLWDENNSKLNSTLFVFDLPEDSKLIKIYFWNIKEVEFSLDNIKGSINKVLKE